MVHPVVKSFIQAHQPDAGAKTAPRSSKAVKAVPAKASRKAVAKTSSTARKGSPRKTASL
jgi:hypothetical protein